jgi:type I restriction enzyme M protein
MLVVLWAKLSQNGELPSEFSLERSLLDRPLDAQSALSKAIDEGCPELRGSRIIDLVAAIDARTLASVLELILRLVDNGLLEQFDPTDAIATVTSSAYAPPTLDNAALPPEIATLLVRLAGLQPSDSVYVAWEQGQVAGRAARQAASVYLETRHSFDFPVLVSLLSRRPFEVHYADPISSPTAVEAGKVRKFDVSIGTPPFNQRYGADVAERDWFARFPERTTLGSVLTLRHLLAHSSRRVVLVVSNNLLFGSGVEESVRTELVEKGMIDTVIDMPSGLLYGTNISFSILILDPQGGHTHVRFISADQDRFKEPISKARARLINIDDLVAMAESGYDELPGQGYGAPSTSRVLQAGATLLAARYLIPKKQQRALDFLNQHRQRARSLGDLVSSIRPMPTTIARENAIEAREIGAADLPKYGYITAPGRTVLVDRDVAEKNSKQFLRPLDILLIIKGSVGKLGIVPSDVPPPGPEGWVAGQSAIVLRVKENAIDPRALMVQLRSSFTQSLLESFTLRATIPLIQVKYLMKLWVLMDELPLMKRAAEAIEREASIQKQIDQLTQQQAEAARDLWAI